MCDEEAFIPDYDEGIGDKEIEDTANDEDRQMMETCRTR